jgi:hypothetical protein
MGVQFLVNNNNLMYLPDWYAAYAAWHKNRYDAPPAGVRNRDGTYISLTKTEYEALHQAQKEKKVKNEEDKPKKNPKKSLFHRHKKTDKKTDKEKEEEKTPIKPKRKGP